MKYVIALFSSIFIVFHLNAQRLNPSTLKGLDLMKNGDVDSAIEYLVKASEQNDMVAQFYLALCNEKGIGMSPNPERAFRDMRRVAERGLPDAMLMLSRYYELGVGIPSNIQKTEDWERRYRAKGGANLLPDFEVIYKTCLDAMSSKVLSQQSEQIAAEPMRKWGPVQPIQERSLKESTIGREIQPKEDVNVDIPVTVKVSNNTFAVVIANENYQEVDNVEYAHNDGRVFAEYCKKTLGVPERNIHFITDATLNNIRKEIDWLNKVSEAYKAEASFIFYYAGHGMPDEKTHEAYILPVDGSALNPSTGYSLTDIYKQLSTLSSIQTLVFLDACFSGNQRSERKLVADRGISIKPKNVAFTTKSGRYPFTKSGDIRSLGRMMAQS